MSFQRKTTLCSTLVLMFLVFPNFHVSSTDVNFQIYVEDVPTFQGQQDIRNSKGDTIFQVHFNKNSKFSNLEVRNIIHGFNYWTRILKKADNGIPVIIEVSKKSFGAQSKNVLARYWGGFLLEPLINGKVASYAYGNGVSGYNHAHIHINEDTIFSLGDNTYHPSKNNSPHPSLSKVIMHEIGHGVLKRQAQTGGALVEQVVGLKGQAPTDIIYDGSHIVNSPDSLMYPSYPYGPSFLLEHELAFIQEQGWLGFNRGEIIGSSLYANNQNLVNNVGYSKLNSNGTGYIEDYNPNSFGIGFFLYGNDNRVVQKADILTKGRMSRGIWVDGENNTLTVNSMTKVHANGGYGIGVFVGKNNNQINIADNAQIYANGPYGIGVYIKGQNTSFILNKDAKIHAHGSYGTGIFVSKSINGSLILNGEISALGKKGIGLNFSGNDAKAKTVYINGSLLGRDKALYIDKSASIRDVKISAESRIQGDIVSEEQDLNAGPISDLINLTFGYDSKSPNSTHEKKFTYSHALKGNRLKVEIEGPTAFYNSRTHAIESLTILPEASLEANGIFRLAKWEDNPFYRALNESKRQNKINPRQYEDYDFFYARTHRGYFYNQGELSPGSETSRVGNITIDGPFWQDKKGTLAIDIDKDGNSDRIHITGDAHLGGTLQLRLEKGFLEHSWRRNFIFLTTGGSIKNDFHAIKWPSSPTLGWELGDWGFDADKERKSYSVRVSQNPRPHNPQLDPNYKSELESIQKRQFDERMSQDNSGRWGGISSKGWDETFKQQERLSLAIDFGKKTQVHNNFSRQLSDLRDKVSTFNTNSDLYPEKSHENKQDRENYEKLRVSFITFDKEVHRIIDAHGKQRDALDRLYSQSVLSPEQNQEAENCRKALKDLRDYYNQLMSRYYSELRIPLSLKADSETDQHHNLSEDFISDELFPKTERHEEGNRLTVKIPENAYSQYATTDNERAVGVVLDKLRRLPKKAVTSGLQTFYEALDFSSPDGSEVGSSLAQLLPEAYGAAFYASLNREYLITDTLRARPSGPGASLGRWSGFALPFSAQVHRKSVAQRVGYSTRTSGLVFGLEKESTAVAGLMWGIHGAVTQKGSLNFKTADNAHGSFQAWDLGLQMHYQPNNRTGFDVMAHVRFGLEQGTINRRIVCGSYAAEQHGKWLGWTSSSAVSGTYLWSLNSIVSVGPILGLEYVTVTHPQIVERSAEGLDLFLDPTGFRSLRSSLGMRGVVFLNDKLKMDLQARWDRDLIHQKLYHGVGFLGYENESFFFSQKENAPFQSLYTSGQMTYNINSQVSVGARAAAQFSRSARPEFSGNLAVKVQF